ncbi:hypothetical protein HPB52_009139 [Rhipicephalus sanguineus]|uniref:Peptidase M13 N-terminal domain-containing protein n=1 Tax=Rhipicephalus sanguineus TaxID=34632 RepID=A0A9D4SU75_RHISA|nr:hypothetical protein HPB52_009139 [Rhipicephalus sanguineus]
MGILFAIVFSVLLLALYIKSWRPRRKSLLLPAFQLDCRSADCLKYEQLLRTTLNMSVHPCEDFKAFVTSIWLPGYSTEGHIRWALKWNIRYQWVRMAVEQMRRHHFTSSAMSAAVNSFEACRDHDAENAEATRSLFKHFLQNLSIPWPEVPTHTVDELDLLIKLCVKWNIPLWFSAKMLPYTTDAGQKIIQIGPSAFAPFWMNLYEDMDSADVRRHIERYLKHFSAPAGGRKVDYFMIFNMTRAIVSELSALCTRKSEKLTLDDFARRFSVSTDHCISVMNKYFKPNTSFISTDMVIVRPEGTIDAAQRFTSKYKSSLIQSHVGWWVLQIFAPVADDLFFVYKYGSKEAADEIRPLFCQAQTEQAYNLVVLAHYINLRFPPSARHSVDLVLNNVREEAATFFESSTPPSAKNKRIARMLRDMEINLWPRQEYLSDKVLSRIYGNHRTRYKNAFEHWIAARTANGELIGSDAYFESTRMAHTFSAEPFAYDEVLNSATLSMVTVDEPFYYKDVNKAISYGGLGAAFLKTVLQGIGDGQDPDNSNTSSPRDEKHGAANSASTCPSVPNAGRTSIRSTLRAFKATNETDSLSNSLGYTPEAFFFITYCHTQSRLQPSFDCNDELRGLDSFLTAFSCPNSSRMHH